MEQLSAVRTVAGKAWLTDETQENYWAEGYPAEIEVERTEDDEIRVGVRLGNAISSDDATIYLSRSEAIRFVLAVAQAVGDR